MHVLALALLLSRIFVDTYSTCDLAICTWSEATNPLTATHSNNQESSEHLSGIASKTHCKGNKNDILKCSLVETCTVYRHEGVCPSDCTYQGWIWGRGTQPPPHHWKFIKLYTYVALHIHVSHFNWSVALARTLKQNFRRFGNLLLPLVSKMSEFLFQCSG